MTPRRSSSVLSNRALLERQLLLRRSRRGALETIEKEGHSLLLFAAADAEEHDVRV